MFDLGWLELIVIGIVALIVVGPKDLPGMFRTVGRFMGKMRGMAREFQRSMEEAADETGLKEATKGLNSLRDVATSPTRAAKDFASDMMSNDIAEMKGKKPADGKADAKPAAATAATKPADATAKTAAPAAAPAPQAEPSQPEAPPPAAEDAKP